MKRFIFYSIIALLSCSFIAQSERPEELKPGNTSFLPGEVLTYRCHYGIFNAGEGKMQVNPETFKVNGKTCYKINVFGKSIGAFALMLRVKDNWRSYVDTNSMQPEKFFRSIEEGNYKLKETMFYNKSDKQVKVYSERENKDPKEKFYDVPEGVHDIVSGYYFLRNIDYSKYKKGDIISIDAFFEDTLYDLKIRYKGTQVIRTKFGKIKAIKLVPIMPDNSFFDGEDSISVWLSDDENHIPLKLKAQMFIGAVEVDIKGYRGLRTKLNFQ